MGLRKLASLEDLSFRCTCEGNYLIYIHQWPHNRTVSLTNLPLGSMLGFL